MANANPSSVMNSAAYEAVELSVDSLVAIENHARVTLMAMKGVIDKLTVGPERSGLIDVASSLEDVADRLSFSMNHLDCLREETTVLKESETMPAVPQR